MQQLRFVFELEEKRNQVEKCQVSENKIHQIVEPQSQEEKNNIPMNNSN